MNGHMRREDEEKELEGETSLNDEQQTRFHFLPPRLMKRPIFAVGWNLSVCFSLSVACYLSLCSSVLFVSGFLLRRSCCVVCSGAATVLRPEVKDCINARREGQSQKKVSLPSLIQSCVMNGPCHPFTASSCSACTSPLFHSTLIQL